MLQNIDFREVVDFTRYELLGNLSLMTPELFETVSESAKKESYERAWLAIMNACSYMTAALNIDDLQAQYK